MWKSFGRLTGVLKHIIVAATIGLTAQLDVFYMAMALLGVFVFSWAQVLEVIAVPRLVELFNSDKKDEFLSLTSGLFVLCFGFSVLICLLMFTCRGFIAKAAWGFDSERYLLLTESFIWLLPVLLFYIPFHFIGSVFRSVRKFSIFYQAHFIIGAVTLVLLILYKDQPNVLYWSYSVSFAFAFAFLFYFFRHGFKIWGPPFSKEILHILKTAPNLLILQTTQHLYILADRFFVSFLGTGSMGALAYGRTISYFLESLLSIRGSFITVFAEATQPAKKNIVYNDLISLAIYLALPLNIFLVLFGKDIIALFLERGMFTNTDTELVSLAVSGFSWALLPVMLQGPMEQIFQVQGRLDLIVLRTLSGLLTNIVLNSVFVFILGWGIWGIALATAIGHWVVLIVGIGAAGKLALKFNWRGHLAWMAWIIAGVMLTSLVVHEIVLSFALKYQVVLQAFLFSVLTLLLGVSYWGAEGKLVRGVVKRVVLKRE